MQDMYVLNYNKIIEKLITETRRYTVNELIFFAIRRQFFLTLSLGHGEINYNEIK